MNDVGSERVLHKDDIIDGLSSAQSSTMHKYCYFFVGCSGIYSLAKYELIMSIVALLPGAAGYLFRKKTFPLLLNKCGSGVNWGRNVSLRHPQKIEIGDSTAIDDNCLLDARSLVEGPFRLGSDVLVARGSMIQAKSAHGYIDIGSGTCVSARCVLNSITGIRIGDHVGLSPQCFIGGGVYDSSDPEVPIIKQKLLSKGPVEIGDGSWIGAGAKILDGVRIGKGAIVGAGTVVQEDVPDFAIATSRQRMMLLKRSIR